MITAILMGMAMAAPQSAWSDACAPALCQDLAAQPEESIDAKWNVEPGTTRAGSLRFLGSDLLDPVWIELYLLRLEAGGESSQHRRALVDLIQRAGGAESLLALLETETDQHVRAVIIEGVKRLDTPIVQNHLLRAGEDTSPAVRAAAMRMAVHHPEADVAGMLEAGLTDSNSQVRASAARSIGWLGETTLSSQTAALLEDSNPEVRLNALNAIRRIAPEEAVARASALSLDKDPDHRISRAAKQILKP
jgi:HEAT repeat protein